MHVQVSALAMALWLMLDEELGWLSAALMKCGRCHPELLEGLAAKPVASLCSFGGLWASSHSLRLCFPKGSRLHCKICLSDQRGAQPP